MIIINCYILITLLIANGLGNLVQGDLTEDEIGLGGWVLNLVRCKNPLIKASTLESKKAILMVHGISSNANCFVSNSVGVHPKDLSDLNMSSMSLEKLKETLANEPSRKSLAFLASNCGYDVWLLNRRGSPQSRRHLNKDMEPLKSHMDFSFEDVSGILPNLLNQSVSDSKSEFETLDSDTFVEGVKKLFNPNGYPKHMIELDNPRFWNFSMDEQALIDLPEIIEYILLKTDRQKLTYVGHSMGGALPLMMLAARPEMTDKLCEAHLWAPALDLSDTVKNNLFVQATLVLKPFLESNSIQNPPFGLDNVLRWIIRVFCRPLIIRDSICSKAMDFIGGDSGLQNELYVAIYDSLNSCSSHELSSLLQSNKKGRMHFFDWRSKEKNLIAYGQEEPPEYDISTIHYKLDLWTGNSDNIVTPKDTKAIVDLVPVEPNVHFIEGPGVLFNHFSFINHKNVADLLIIPNMKEIAENTCSEYEKSRAEEKQGEKELK